MTKQKNKLAAIRYIAILVAIVMSAVIFAACTKKAEDKDDGKMTMLALTGPTGMGFGKIYKDIQDQEDSLYDLKIESTIDMAIAELAAGRTDVATLPSNNAIAAINSGNDWQIVSTIVGNVMSILQRTDADPLGSIGDLDGKTISVPAKGAVPDVVIQDILKQNGLEGKVQIEYAPDQPPTSIISGLVSGSIEYALLPQPLATTAIVQSAGNVEIALDIADEWDAIHANSSIATAVIVARKSFIQNKPKTFEKFLQDYKASVEFMTEPSNLEQAAQIVVDMGLIPALPIAKQALPATELVNITGQDNMDILKSFFQILFDFDSEMIGGKMPSDDAFFIA